MLRRDLLPGGLDQDVVHGKGLKILLPVVDPVLVLGLRGRQGPGAQIRIGGHLIQAGFHIFQNLLHILLRIQIEAHLGYPLVRRKLRKDVDEHPLCLLLRQGDIVLNLDPLNAQIVQHAADKIHRLCGGGQSKFFPFHTLTLLVRGCQRTGLSAAVRTAAPFGLSAAYVPLITLTNSRASTTSTTGRTILLPSWTTSPAPR